VSRAWRLLHFAPSSAVTATAIGAYSAIDGHPLLIFGLSSLSALGTMGVAVLRFWVDCKALDHETRRQRLPYEAEITTAEAHAEAISRVAERATTGPTESAEDAALVRRSALEVAQTIGMTAVGSTSAADAMLIARGMSPNRRGQGSAALDRQPKLAAVSGLPAQHAAPAVDPRGST
jgi:hypothetical protein